ncbi:glycosyl hydrolase family 28-related protein [Terriglobus sp.]|uniref:glycosyl hydrolase family 28-related protein n=1 Tax=Terriglobus sp. TaxID=1889013 RepID=UPI003AFFC3E8
MSLARQLALLLSTALLVTAGGRSQASASDAAGPSGIVNARAQPYGAKADGATEDTAALNSAINDARRTHALLYLPQGTYRILSTLDVTGLSVIGAGRENTIIHLDGAVQQNAVVSRGNTLLRDLEIFGGWDGHTGGLTGAGFAMLSDPAAKPPYLGYDVRLDNVSIQYSKQDCIFIEQGGYESLHNVKCNAAGRHGLMLESDKNPGFATTTVNVDGLSTFSDTGSFAVYIHDGQTISFSGRTTMENTSGIKLAGINGRTLKISGIHQENTRTGKFLDAAESSGIGLTLTDNFIAGSPISGESPNELDHWVNITTDANGFGFYATGIPTVVKPMATPDAEPVEILPGSWRFTPAQPIAIGMLQHPHSAAWSARLVGHWVTGDGTPKVAHEFLITSKSPTVQVGPTAFRFSLDANGRLQASVTPPPGLQGPFEFLGVVELVVDRQHSDSQDIAIETAAGARLGTARVNALAGKGSSQVCATEDGTLYRCGK